MATVRNWLPLGSAPANPQQTDMAFEHTIGHQDGLRLITISGRLTEKEQSQVLVDAFEAMLANGESKFLLEMPALEYVNSSGLNLLIGMFTRARNAGGELAICGISDKVRKLMVMTRLDSVFKIHGSVAEAIAHFNA